MFFHYFKPVFLVLLCLNLSCQKAQEAGGWTKDIHVTVIEGSATPLIGRSHPGSADNGWGYENGYSIYHDGHYHILIVEMFEDGKSGAGYWMPARIGHWISADGDTWKRHATIVEGNNVDKDVKQATWSSSFYWNDDENRWNIFWRGTNSAFRYRSTVAGHDGITGPYEEVKCVVPPDGDRGNKLWYSGFIHSFGNVFKGTDGNYYSFFSDYITENNYVNWPTGLLYSKNGVDGPWKYLETKTPVFNYCENPMVSFYDGMYYATYDELAQIHSIGVGYSEDGVNWRRTIVDLEGYVPWAAQKDLLQTVRTPMGLIKDADGLFTVFFTAYNAQTEYFEIGKLRLKIDITELTQKEKDREKYKLNLTDDNLWTGINGKWLNEYDGLSIFDTSETSYIRTYNQQIYTDFEAEVTLRAVGITLENRTFSKAEARAGLVFGKKNPTTTLEPDDYHVYVDANRKLVLAQGEKILMEENIQQSILTFRTLKVIVKNSKLSVFFAGSNQPVLEYKLTNYSGGHVALFAGKEHIHFESMYLKK